MEVDTIYRFLYRLGILRVDSKTIPRKTLLSAILLPRLSSSIFESDVSLARVTSKSRGMIVEYTRPTPNSVSPSASKISDIHSFHFLSS